MQLGGGVCSGVMSARGCLLKGVSAWGCLPHPLHHWVDTPSSETTTEAGGTHPTGMHSCYKYFRRVHTHTGVKSMLSIKLNRFQWEHQALAICARL